MNICTHTSRRFYFHPSSARPKVDDGDHSRGAVLGVCQQGPFLKINSRVRHVCSHTDSLLNYLIIQISPPPPHATAGVLLYLSSNSDFPLSPSFHLRDFSASVRSFSPGIATIVKTAMGHLTRWCSPTMSEPAEESTKRRSTST